MSARPQVALAVLTLVGVGAAIAFLAAGVEPEGGGGAEPRGSSGDDPGILPLIMVPVLMAISVLVALLVRNRVRGLGGVGSARVRRFLTLVVRAQAKYRQREGRFADSVDDLIGTEAKLEEYLLTGELGQVSMAAEEDGSGYRILIPSTIAGVKEGREIAIGGESPIPRLRTLSAEEEASWQ